MILKIAQLFTMFLVYSCFGWIVEVIYCMIVDSVKNHKLTISNRGFLGGPLCPIYGVGAITMLLCLSQFKESIPMLFVAGLLVCDVVEYMTSFLMEKLFGARWWDYSKDFLNINGRISLKHSLLWGVASVAFIRFVHPFVNQTVFTLFGERETIYIAAGALFLFTYDVVNTMITTYNIKAVAGKIKEMRTEFFKDFSENTQERKEKIPKYTTELRERISTATNSHQVRRMRRILREYPRLVDLMQNELFEIQSVPHEFAEEFKGLQEQLEDMINDHRDKTEMH